MTPVTRRQILYFFAVGALALWVGLWGFFIPERVDQAIPWLVPPLHARFIGAIYLGGTVMMGSSMVARTFNEVRVPAILSAVWTGSLFIISLFYLNEFDFSRRQVWFWFAAYLAYPIIGFWFAWTNPSARESSTAPDLPGWIRGILRGEGTLLTVLALALLTAPDFMLTIWPWKVTRLLIQIYSGPFLAIGIAGLMLSRERTWSAIRIVVSGVFTLAAGVLLASAIHLSLFSFANPTAWLWFGGFMLLLVLHAVMLLSPKAGPGTHQ